MIIRGKNVIGLNIVTVNTGKIIETVDDIVYNPVTQRIEALLVSSGGLFGRAKAIHIDTVHAIGEDAVIVNDELAITSVKELKDDVQTIANSKHYLVKTNVLTVEGKELGKITDIYFDSTTGVVASMEVSQGGFKTLTDGKKSIRPSDIVTIGADATIVNSYTEVLFEEQGERNGLKGALNSAKEKAEEVSDDVRKTAENATDSLKEKGSEFGKNLKTKTDEATEYAEERTTQFVTNTKKNAAHAEERLNDVKEKSATKIDTVRIKGDTVVTETTKAIKNGKEKIEMKKKRIARK